jgi:hypothetical protein
MRLNRGKKLVQVSIDYSSHGQALKNVPSSVAGTRLESFLHFLVFLPSGIRMSSVTLVHGSQLSESLRFMQIGCLAMEKASLLCLVQANQPEFWNT